MEISLSYKIQVAPRRVVQPVLYYKPLLRPYHRTYVAIYVRTYVGIKLNSYVRRNKIEYVDVRRNNRKKSDWMKFSISYYVRKYSYCMLHT